MASSKTQGNLPATMHETHAGTHEDKLCAMTCCRGKIDVNVLKPIVKNPKYICSDCGHAAANAENLCSPKEL